MDWILRLKESVIGTFPEIAADIATLENDIANANCKGCVKNRRLRSIFTKLLAFANDRRAISEDLREYFPTNKTATTAPVIPVPAPTLIQPVNLSDTRPGCEYCVRKHLSQALILLRECNQGYGNDDQMHKWLAIGHLSEAADEALEVNPHLSRKVRELRLKIMDQK